MTSGKLETIVSCIGGVFVGLCVCLLVRDCTKDMERKNHVMEENSVGTQPGCTGDPICHVTAIYDSKHQVVCWLYRDGISCIPRGQLTMLLDGRPVPGPDGGP